MQYFVPPTFPKEVAKQIKDHVLRTDLPHLEPFYPDKIEQIIEVENTGSYYRLATDDGYEPPELTWREFNDSYLHLEIDELLEREGLSEDDLDNEADYEQVDNHWRLNPNFEHHPVKKVFYMLYGLDLGTDKEILDELDLNLLLGHVWFVDGPSPGSNYQAVHVSSAAALSALQWKLTDLKKGIKIIATH